MKDCLHAIAGHVIKAFTGYDSIFYNPVLGALALFDFILLLVFLTRILGKRGGKGIILFFYLALLATPFMMTVVLGGTPAMRSQMVLPAVAGFLGYLGIELVRLQSPCQGRRQGILLCCVLAICLLGGAGQAKVTGQLYYTDWCRYEQDAAIGRSVIEKIEQVRPEEEILPVAVVGGREFSGNHSCVVGEVIGRSFFNYDREVEPVPFWSTRRVLGFLHTLGADYVQIPLERAGEALKCSADMPVWPAEDSVQVRNGMIIVKLSSE